MGEFNINIRQLLAEAYGHGMLSLYRLPNEKLKAADQQIKVIGDETESDKFLFEPGDEKGESTGLLGLPIFQQVMFTDGDESLYLGDSLVDITLQKNIVKTQVTGMVGTIKEFISNGDYQVNIKGFLVSKNPYKAPESQIRAMRDWFTDKPRAIGVEGKIFEFFGIERIVVESYNFPQLPTYINIRPYELHCVSDLGTLKTIELNND